MPDPQSSTLANEFTQDQETESTRSTDNNNFLNQRKKAAAAEPQQAPNANRLPASNDANNPAPRRRLPKWVTWAWDANISPFSFVRWSGPLGPRLVSGWTSRRFSHLPDAEAAALHDYAYSLFRLRGSGEYALAYILAPGAFARSPLIHRIGRVGHGTLPDGSNEGGVPVVLLYGENDWMDVKGGYAAKKKIDAERERVLKGKGEEERKNDAGGAKVVIVKKAGHHVYLDSPEEFNEIMRREMDDTVKRHKGERKGSAVGGVEVVVPGGGTEVVQQGDIRY